MNVKHSYIEQDIFSNKFIKKCTGITMDGKQQFAVAAATPERDLMN